ncbi:MAG: polyphosphate polymerase domain-containing protein [Bacteroidales bacterium]
MDRAIVQAALNDYMSVSLEEMDSVRLMNRVDTKYLFAVGRLPELLSGCSDCYKVLEIKNYRIFDYSTTYFDTPEYLFYYQHVTGRLSRNKIRFRTYETTGEKFLEIKRKTNKNRTIKYRIESPDAYLDPSSEKNSIFIGKHTGLKAGLLKPVVDNRFKRVTLVSGNMDERITIDFNVSFSDQSGKVIEIPSVCVLEMKRSGYSSASGFSSVLKSRLIRPTGFSKYCIGAAQLYNMERKNTLKSKILAIDRLTRENENMN